MLLEWIEQSGLLRRAGEAHTLWRHPLDVRRPLVRSLVTLFYTNPEEAHKTLQTFHNVRWTVECIGQAFTLPLEDHRLIRMALVVFHRWLAFPSRCPPALARHFNFFFDQMVRHLSLLFEPRAPRVSLAVPDEPWSPTNVPSPSAPSNDEDSDTSSYIDVQSDEEGSRVDLTKTHEALAFRALKVLSKLIVPLGAEIAALRFPGEAEPGDGLSDSVLQLLQSSDIIAASVEREPSRWGNFLTVVKVLIGIIDFGVRGPGRISDVVDCLAAKVLFSLLLRSQTTSEEVWGLVQRYTARWADSLQVVYQWHRAFIGLTFATVPGLLPCSAEPASGAATTRLAVEWGDCRLTSCLRCSDSNDSILHTIGPSGSFCLDHRVDTGSTDTDEEHRPNHSFLFVNPSQSHNIAATTITVQSSFAWFVWFLWPRLFGEAATLQGGEVAAEYLQAVHEVVHVLATACWEGEFLAGKHLQLHDKAHNLPLPRPKPFPNPSPRTSDILMVFASTLFRVFNQAPPPTVPPESTALLGQGFALQALLAVYCRRETTAAAEVPHLPAFYGVLLQCLGSGSPEELEDIRGPHMTLQQAVLVYGADLFTWDLPGVHILLSAFVCKVDRVLATSRCTVLRLAALAVLRSIVALPEALSAQFPTWGREVGGLLRHGLAHPGDAAELGPLLDCVALYLRTYGAREDVRPLLDLVLAILASPRHPATVRLFCLAVFEGPVLGIADAVSSSSHFAAEVVGVISRHLLELCSRLGQSWHDAATPSADEALADEAAAAFYVLTDWVLAFPTPVQAHSKSCQALLSVLEVGLSMQHPKLLKVHEAAWFLYSHLLRSTHPADVSGTLAVMRGMEESLVAEDLKPGAWDRVVGFCFSEATMLTVVEPPPSAVEPPGVGQPLTVVYRNAMGRFTWDWQPIGVDPPVPEPPPPPAAPRPEDDRRFSFSFGPGLGPVWEARRRAVSDSPPASPTTHGVPSDGPGERRSARQCLQRWFRDSLQDVPAAPPLPHVDLRPTPVAPVDPQPSWLDNAPLEASSSATRLLLSRMGWLAGVGFPHPLHALRPSPELQAHLRMLDATPVRECFHIPLLFVGDSADGDGRDLFDRFVRAVAWEPRPAAAGPPGHPSRLPADAAVRHWADYAAEVTFAVQHCTPASCPPAPSVEPGWAEPHVRVLWNASSLAYCPWAAQTSNAPGPAVANTAVLDIVVVPHETTDLCTIRLVPPSNARQQPLCCPHLSSGMVVGPTVLPGLLRDACIAATRHLRRGTQYCPPYLTRRRLIQHVCRQHAATEEETQAHLFTGWRPSVSRAQRG
eukprot:EG_transcript_679